MKHATTILTALAAAAVLLGPAGHAASPPTIVNYQGVLRDASDTPLDGDHDMVFRFLSAETGGDEILIDRHTTGDSAPVAVTGGLFSVRLGAGAVQDGSGPGTHTSLATVFRDYTEVWLRVEVGGEVLDPRVQIVSSAYALNAKNLDGRSAAGFINTTSSAQAKAGRLTINSSAPGVYGLDVFATNGAYFENTDWSTHAYVADGNWGIEAYGNTAGGRFHDLDGSGWADIGANDTGIFAYGNAAGGSFGDLDGSGRAEVAVGDTGIEAYGDEAGGFFETTSGSSNAEVARNSTGVTGRGNWAGGRFEDLDESAIANVGYGDTGIVAWGNEAGGRFNSLVGLSYAEVGLPDYGIRAWGSEAGGTFNDRDQSGLAYVANGNWGIGGYGDSGGGYFEDTNGSGFARVGYSTYKIDGNGTVNFVQNHPEQADRVIVYTAPEGDEVATYTRGTARLAGGEARVALGETFKWVTNPDIGLTAHLTPREDCRGLYVESLTTSDLVVRERDGGSSDVVFDYVVYGLRIGFEEVGVVQEKTVEAMIPSMQEHRDLYERQPELRSFSALERFKGMVIAVESIDTVDLSRAAELKAAIQEYDLAVHGPTDRLLGHGPPSREREAAEGSSPELVKNDAAEADPDLDGPAPRQEPIAGPAASDSLTATELRGEPLPTSEALEAGQVIALDPEHPGSVHAAFTMADPGVVGVAAGMAEEAFEARVVVTGLVECKVDAAYGAIRPGDLLTSSPTRGHAMRAIDTPAGTILGKALEPLETGTGTIRILVMPR